MDQFTYVKRGYDPEEVDKYIGTLEQVIKSYKDKDNAIKNAIISAQVAADNVVRNAQMHADAYKVQIGEQLIDMRKTLDRQRMSLQAFQESYARIVRQCIQELEKSDMSDLFTRIDEMEAAIADLQGMDAPPSPAPVAALPDNRMDPRADKHPEYLGHDRNYGHPPQPDPRDRPREYEAPREYQPAPQARDMYEDPREAMRASTQKFHDALFETERPFTREQYEPAHEPQRGGREMPQAQAHDAFPPKSAPPFAGGYDTPQPDPYQGGHMREEPPQARVAPDPYQQHQPQPPQRDPRDLMREHDGRMHQPPPPQDAFPAPQPRDMRDMTPHDGRDFMPEPANLHAQARDTRRDPGRDMRGPVRADVRRDPAREMMRPPEREPMRDNRPFMPEPDGYVDDDQNLLPPVASLM